MLGFFLEKKSIIQQLKFQKNYFLNKKFFLSFMERHAAEFNGEPYSRNGRNFRNR